MRKRRFNFYYKILFLLGLIVTIFIVFFACDISLMEKNQSISVPPKPDSEISEYEVSEDMIGCMYYNEKDFVASVNKAEKIEIQNFIQAGIVPHHLLAGDMIASFFKTLANSEPEVLILIGPNHKRVGEKKINTGRWNWNTPFGVLEADDKVFEDIFDSVDYGEDIGLLFNEHSISGLVPYVKYYMPDTKLIPIVLHGNLSLEDSKTFARSIFEATKGKKCIVVGSVDFSHYLSPEKADEMDTISLKAIKERDIETISKMNNDYLDTPPTIITIIELTEMLEAEKLEIMGHSNSAIISGEYSESTTSYFTILFSKE